MPSHPKHDKTGEIVRPTIELRPWVRDLHAWLKKAGGGRAGRNPPHKSLQSPSSRGESQQEVAVDAEVRSEDSLSDSSDSSGSSSGDVTEEEVLRESPYGASSRGITMKNTTPRSAPRIGTKVSRPSPWRRYLESVVEAKIQEHFEAQAAPGGIAEMRSREEYDGAKGMSHDGEEKNMEGKEDNKAERNLEAGLHQAHVDPANDTMDESTKRHDAGEETFRGMAEDMTEQDRTPLGRGVQGHKAQGIEDKFSKAKLQKKDRAKKTNESKKSGLAREIFNWLVFDGPSSSSEQARNRRYDRERGVEGGKGTDKQPERSLNNEAVLEHDDPAWNPLSLSPSPHHARHRQRRDQHSISAIHALHSPRAKTSLARDLVRWILGSQKSPLAPAQKWEGRHLSYATTHGTSMRRVEQLLRQGLEVERGLEAEYHDLPGKKRKERGETRAKESTKVKIGKMVLKYLIGEGERGIRDAGENMWEKSTGERRRRSTVRDEGLGDKGSITSQRSEKHIEGHESNRNSENEPVRTELPSSLIGSLPPHSPLPSETPLPSSTAGEQPPPSEPQPEQKPYHLPSPTDSELST